MNTKLHAITDTSGRPIRFFITAGRVSDHTGAAALMNDLPDAISVWTKFQYCPAKPKNGHAREEVSITVLMYPRLGASREEKKQGASSPTLLGRR
jgi:hypothetical protein